MGATTDSTASARSQPESKLPAFALDQPFRTVVAMSIVLAGVIGAVAFAYTTVLSERGIAPRTDALAIMGILAVLLLTSGVLLATLRQSEAIERGVGLLREQRTRRFGEIETLQDQAEQLQQTVGLLTEQQSTHRALYSPALEIDWLRATDRDEPADMAQFTATNLSFGAALNVTVRSEIELIDPPEDYAVSGGRAICPATRIDTRQRSARVPPYAEGLDIGTSVLVDVSENLAQERKHTVTCRFTDAVRAFYDDGVEAVDLSFEITYEDVFGEEYTERIQLPRAELTEEMTLEDVLSSPQASGGSDDTGV